MQSFAQVFINRSRLIRFRRFHFPQPPGDNQVCRLFILAFMAFRKFHDIARRRQRFGGIKLMRPYVNPSRNDYFPSLLFHVPHSIRRKTRQTATHRTTRLKRVHIELCKPHCEVFVPSRGNGAINAKKGTGHRMQPIPHTLQLLFPTAFRQ